MTSYEDGVSVIIIPRCDHDVMSLTLRCACVQQPEMVMSRCSKNSTPGSWRHVSRMKSKCDINVFMWSSRHYDTSVFMWLLREWRHIESVTLVRILDDSWISFKFIRFCLIVAVVPHVPYVTICHVLMWCCGHTLSVARRCLKVLMNSCEPSLTMCRHIVSMTTRFQTLYIDRFKLNLIAWCHIVTTTSHSSTQFSWTAVSWVLSEWRHIVTVSHIEPMCTLLITWL